MNNPNFLKDQWIQLVSKYTDDSELISSVYRDIENKYSSPNRHYHNLEHIKSMLIEVKSFKNEVKDFDAILFAIWFHDIIYNIKQHNNEERSADIAKEFLNNTNFDTNRTSKVVDLILKTKSHTNFNDIEDFDTKIFLDCDVLILGENREIYRKYLSKIRNEYNFIPDKIYKKERIKILKKFLNSPFIYKTEKFRSHYEKQARKNLKFEIKLLS